MIYKTKKEAINALFSQPIKIECRSRYEIVSIFNRNLLGEKINNKPIGYGYRIKSIGKA